LNGRLLTTPECAMKIGNIIKYVSVNETLRVSYSLYMQGWLRRCGPRSLLLPPAAMIG
jgi:hypothetical protein